MFETASARETSVRAIRPAFPIPESISLREATTVEEGAPSAAWNWLAAALDELDYGILLLVGDGHAAYINHAARVELAGDHPLQILRGSLRARLGFDAAPLHDAIDQASLRGLRRLLTVGQGARRASLSIVPLPMTDTGQRAVLVVLGKTSMCESLSVQAFARAHGLTSAETRVLAALCGGTAPADIARQLRVAISTIRTQISNIRAKAGAESIRSLLQQLALLPPLMSILQHSSPLREHPRASG